jgi:lipoprotein-anchoring transpeptidase ErfK/SrfK
MGMKSPVVLRGALAVAITVMASCLLASIAAAQQVANAEEETIRAPSTDEDSLIPTDTRQIVPFHTTEAPGTIIIDTGERYLFLVQQKDLAAESARKAAWNEPIHTELLVRTSMDLELIKCELHSLL